MTADMTSNIATVVVTTGTGQLATETREKYKNPAANCVKIIIYQNPKKM